MYIEEAKEIINRTYSEQLKKMIAKQYAKKDTDFLKVKFKHGFECYHLAIDVIEKDEKIKNKNDLFKQRLEIACLLHDIGRLFELTNELEGVKHGDFGANLLEHKENFKDKLVLIAIRHHDEIDLILENDKDYISLDDKEKEDAKEISLAVRDVDKISNLYLFKRENVVYTRKPRKFGFSIEYFEALTNKHRIDKKYKNTIFDSIAYYIIWYYELIYQSSKDFVISYGLIDHLIDMFRINIEEVAKIEQDNMTARDIVNTKYKMKRNLVQIMNILKKDKIIS